MRLFVILAMLFISNILISQEECFDKNGFTELIQIQKAIISFSEISEISKSTCAIILNEEECINDGDIIIFSFKDGSVIQKPNKKEFNCKGVAFYWLSKDDLNDIKSKEIDYIAVATYSGAKANIITASQSKAIKRSIDCVLN